MEEKSLREKVINSIIWASSGTIFIQIISWVSTIIVIRLLTPSDYGLMAMALPVMSFLQMISMWGLGTAIVQHKELNETKIRQLFGFILLIFSVAVVLIWLSAPFIASFFHETRLTPLLRLLSMNFILMSLYMIPDSLLYREMNFRLKTHVDISSRLVAALVAPICALNSMGVWSLAIAEVCFHSIRVIHFNIIFRKWHSPIFHFDECRDLIKFAMTVTGTVFFVYLFNQADKIIVGRYLGKDLLGFYAVAFTLALLPKEKILPIITQLSFSAYSKIQHDLPRIKLNLLKTIEIVAFVAFPLFWGMASVAAEGLPLILGPHWAQASIPFEYLCIVIPFLTISPLFPPALNAIGKPEIAFWNSVIESIVMVITLFISVRFGLKGISLSWICFYPLVFLYISRKSLKSIGLSINEMLVRIKFPIIASLFMSLLVILLKRTLLEVTNPLFMLLISFVIGTTLYSILIFIYKRDMVAELKGFYNAGMKKS
jgi:teichuronic acid exporter